MLRLIIILVLAWTLPGAMAGQELTEQEAIARLSADSPRARALAAGVEAAKAAAQAEGLRPNGAFTFSREAAGGVPETYLLYQQPLSLNGRLELLRSSAFAAVRSEEALVALQIHELRSGLRLAFLDLLAAQERSELMQSESVQLQEIVRILRAREQAGESSGYDRIRAERELSLLSAEQSEMEARLARARAGITAYFAPGFPSNQITAHGSIELSRLPDADSLIGRALRRGDIESERQVAESRSLAAEAARRRAYPDPIVSGGIKSPVTGGRRDTGYVLSVTIPIPIFDRGTAEVRRAEAEHRAALARSEALQVEVSRLLAGAHAEAEARRTAAEAFTARVAAQTGDLARIARIAYEGGEVGILELLDAYRNQREVLIRGLELRTAARRSALELERLTGEEIIP